VHLALVLFVFKLGHDIILVLLLYF